MHKAGPQCVHRCSGFAQCTQSPHRTPSVCTGWAFSVLVHLSSGLPASGWKDSAEALCRNFRELSSQILSFLLPLPESSGFSGPLTLHPLVCYSILNQEVLSGNRNVAWGSRAQTEQTADDVMCLFLSGPSEGGFLEEHLWPAQRPMTPGSACTLAASQHSGTGTETNRVKGKARNSPLSLGERNNQRERKLDELRAAGQHPRLLPSALSMLHSAQVPCYLEDEQG